MSGAMLIISRLCHWIGLLTPSSQSAHARLYRESAHTTHTHGEGSRPLWPPCDNRSRPPGQSLIACPSPAAHVHTFHTLTILCGMFCRRENNCLGRCDARQTLKKTPDAFPYFNPPRIRDAGFKRTCARVLFLFEPDRHSLQLFD